MYHISEGGACAVAQWHNGQSESVIFQACLLERW